MRTFFVKNIKTIDQGLSVDFSKITHLDLGCGPFGEMVALLIKQGIPLEEILGVDIDLSYENPMISYASDCNKKFPRRGLIIPASLADVHRDVRSRLLKMGALECLNKISDGQLDAIYDNCFLTDVESPEETKMITDEIRRTLKKGGLLVCENYGINTLGLTEYLSEAGFKLRSSNEISIPATLSGIIEKHFFKKDIYRIIFQKPLS